MRAFTTYRQIGIALILVIFTISYVSCSDTGTNIPEEDENIESMISESAEMAIRALGFNPEGAELIGDHYLVEGDIGISKSTINEGINACEMSKGKQKGYVIEDGPDPFEQWATNSTVVDINTVSNITYEIHSSLSNRTSDIEDAIALWNEVNMSRLELTENQTGSADIIIYANGEAEPPYTCLNRPNLEGVAMFPENGSPGGAITVTENLNTDLFITVVAHELGHAFGFRHTDWRGQESTSGDACGVDFSAHHINHTPSASGNVDPQSIMNSGGNNQILADLSSYDRTATRVMYPTSLTAPNIIDLDVDCIDYGGGQFIEGHITVKFPNNLAQAFNVEVKEGNDDWEWANLSGYMDNNQIIHRHYYFNSMSNFDFPKGFRTRSLNFAGDYQSQASTPMFITENDLNCSVE